MRAAYFVTAWVCVLGASSPAWGRTKDPDVKPGAAKAYLGVALAQLTPLDRRQKGVPRYGGVLIQSVLRETPAAKAGFQPGDVIMRLSGRYVYKSDDVIRRVAAGRVGSRMKIDIIRNGKWMMARVLLQARPTALPDRPRPRIRRPPLPMIPYRRDAMIRRLQALEHEVRTLRRLINSLKLCRRR
ncbi:MAG: PDZ domain-containing protein [bacterium]